MGLQASVLNGRAGQAGTASWSAPPSRRL